MIRRIFLFAMMLSVATVALAEEAPPALNPNEPPVDVQFYFSAKDPHLAETDRALASVVKQLPMLKIERVPIDDKAGYSRLADVEKMFDVKEPGERTIVFGPFNLIDKGEKRDIELYFGPMMKRLIGQMKGDNSFKDRLAPNVALYAQNVFGKNAAALAEPDQNGNAIKLYRVNSDGKQVGWVADAYDPIGCPICSSAQLLLATDTNLSILDVSPVREIERLATKMPEAEVAKFVAQFKGKSPKNPPAHVDAISRATKTSHAFQAAISEILEDIKKRATP